MAYQAITFCWNVSDFLQPRNDLSKLSSVLDKERNSRDIRAALVSHSRNGLIPALWLRLLLDLAALTTDERVEVRNSATQTVQRIFESYAEQLSSTVWLLCLRVVLFGMIESNIAVQRNARNTSQSNKDLEGWNDTTRTVLQTVGVQYTAYMDRLEPAQLNDAWSELLERLQQYFSCNSHALGLSVFTTISGVLSHIDNAAALGMPPLLKTADVWKSYFDCREAWTTVEDGNQDAFVAYAEAFKAIYQLAGRSLDPQLPLMLANLEACIVDSDEVAYSSDIDHMTPLQTRISECLAMIETEGSHIPSCLMRLLSRVIVLPYTSVAEKPQSRGPTFVALAKAAMTLLQNIIIKHIDQKQIFEDGSFLIVIRSLAIPIHEKYSWQREGKPPTLWQKATSTAMAILKPAVPRLDAHDESNSSFKDLWTAIVCISHDITRAQFAATDEIPLSIEHDESFDIGSFHKLRDMVTLSLGSATIPDALRRTYTRNLFSVSLIHTPLPGELPDLASAPLEGLYKTRYGQTAELEVAWRMDMSYTCLTELFSLVAAHDGSAPRVKLAQAASPYLILRAALPIKTYIADHPIRGRMPVPEAQRRELLFVLNELGKLKSEPQAIPDAPGVRSRHRKHLHRLYPLLNKASRVARQDAEIFEHVVRLMDMIGEEFGLDDD